jgi:hypothetical protein
MNLKKELENVELLARSHWVRSGWALQLPALLVVGFFAVDIRYNSGRTFIALVYAGGIDGSGVAFGTAQYSLLFLAVTRALPRPWPAV